MREQLASLCHEQWSGWMEYLFSKCYLNRDYLDKETGDLVIPEKFVRRWKRQSKTPYSELSESEKDSDRKEADRILSLINNNNK